MDIKTDIYNNYFFTSHINNMVVDETKPYSLYGYDNARVFKDISTDSFVNNIFDDKKKLFNFVDYTFYSIFTKIPKIHKLLYLNGYFMNNTEYLTVIFKGGNTMSFFFDIIINALAEKNSGIFNEKLNKIHDYLKDHNVDLKIIDDELFYLKSDDTIKDFFNEQKKKFKISDVDFTMYINTNDPVKYNIIHQLYNKILINSLMDIRTFFDSYYLSIKNIDHNKDIVNIKLNPYLPFKSNDSPYNAFIKIIDDLIKNIKSSNMENFYKTSKNNKNKLYSKSIENDFIQIFYNKEFRLIDILLYGCDKRNFLNSRGKYYSEITNIRLITIISEYLELLQIYFNIHKKYKLKSTVQDLLVITRMLINHHLYNKKRLIIDTEMYNIDTINNLLNDIASKYNKDTNPSLYNTKYAISFDKKEIIQKINLIRKCPNSNLDFTKFNEQDDWVNESNNELNILPKSDFLSYSINNPNLYQNKNYNNKYYHYISYNNNIYNSYEQYSKKFDLFRIKFNIRLTKPIIKIDQQIMEEYNIPSEFVDVSIPSFQDINRKYFYSEVQEEGINILKYSNNSVNYYWNTYSIHQLFDDLLKILFGPSIVPWYDSKYDKRIIRLLLLFSFYKIEKSIKKTNSSCEWICLLTDILKLTNELYIYTTNNIDDLLSVQSIKPFILGKKYDLKYSVDQSMIVEKYILDNVFYKLNQLGYNQTIGIDEYYDDFELVVRFLIFYSYSMKKSCFPDVFNNLRYISGLLPYEPNKTIIKDGKEINIIDYNNSKFKELLKLMTNTISVILFILNETSQSCKFTDLTSCVVNQINTNCDYVKPIHYDFDSYTYKYYNDVVEKNNLQTGGKKYIIMNKNKN